MKEVDHMTWLKFKEQHNMEMVGHASPMPSHGYGDDRTYYEGGGFKAEYRVQWEPKFKETFLLDDTEIQQNAVKGD